MTATHKENVTNKSHACIVEPRDGFPVASTEESQDGQVLRQVFHCPHTPTVSSSGLLNLSLFIFSFVHQFIMGDNGGTLVTGAGRP